MNENELFKKRMTELSERASDNFYTVCSDFLNLSQISDLQSLSLPCKPTLYGGYQGAERAVACFGKAEDANISLIHIYTKSEKFAEELSHRDVLGALLSLGIKRETLGDIIIYGKSAYLFCFDSVCRTITDECIKIHHTDVCCEITDALPDIVTAPPPQEEFVVASERLDCIISAVYDVSRSVSKEMFLSKIVFVNGRLTENESYIPKENDIISVRGRGRFRYLGIAKTTKKNKLRIIAAVYR